jgi:release factor glutamine methyltransferase
MTTLAQALKQAAAAGIARLDAQLLLLHSLGRAADDRAWLLAHDEDELATSAAQGFAALCERRAGGEPVAYLVGRREFFGLDLEVDARVLVPRPETETLVDWSLEVLQERQGPRVIDLGTGSGAIALAISHRRRDARVEAVDASADALSVASANAKRLSLQVAFSQGHWLQGRTGPYELIVSNPPYVAEGDAHLAALRHEPVQALVAGRDGLDDVRAIVQQAPCCLATGGWLLLEHGWDQAGAVRDLMRAAGFADVASRRDLAGIERCTGGRRLEHG